MNVRLTPEQKIKILNAEDLYGVMQRILLRENKIRRNQEHFWVVGLNNKNKILFIELVALGSTNILSTTAPDVFRMAIYKMAVSVIFVHNHPSGELEPSKSDVEFTSRMAVAAKLIDINVLDHLLISETDFISFENHGQMPKLLKHAKYELVPAEEEEMRKLKLEAEKMKAKEMGMKEGKAEGIKQGIEEGKRKERIKLAISLRKAGMDDNFIEKMTGLDKGQLLKI